MNLKSVIIIFLVSSLTWCGKSKNDVETIGIVNQVQGSPIVVRLNQRIKIQKGQIVLPGDLIQTSNGELAILVFKNNSASLEIQENASLEISTYLESQKELNLKKGNAWLLVNKLKKDESFQLNTPTSLAAVRGTKFYTFEMLGGVIGTCHCEGEVDFGNTKTDYQATHHKHNVVFVKDNKTVIFSKEELVSLGWPIREEHQHSKINNSIVGKQATEFPAKAMVNFMTVLEQKFNQAKK